MSDKTLHLQGFIDEKRIGAFQYGAVLLCGCVMFLDGIDTQIISYIAPVIAKEWSLSRDVLGPIFSAAFTGLMVGYLLLSPLSDRLGHRRMLIASTVSFGLFTLATIVATNVNELIVLRFLTGLGLGVAAPSAVALTGEYSPKRLRASFVLAIYCGFSLGFVAAGGLAGWLLPSYGWHGVLTASAVPPILLVAALLLWLPESLAYLNRRGDQARLVRVLRRVDPRRTIEADTILLSDEEDRGRLAVASLFTQGRALGTLLLWLVFIINLAEFYAIQSWLPSMLGAAHYPLSVIVLTTSLSTTGGIVAAFLVGPCMDRIGPYGTLAILFLAGVVFVALTGIAIGLPDAILLTATFLGGFCVSGGQKSVIALSAVYYPGPIRSTGVGWALGIGRIGGIAGPLIFGLMISRGWTPAQVFYAAAVPMLVSGVAIAVMGLLYGGRARPAPAGLALPGQGLR